MPLKAQLPINIVDVNLKEYLVQAEIDSGGGLSSTGSSPRSGSMPKYSDILNPMGFERPTDEIVVVAPPRTTPTEDSNTNRSGIGMFAKPVSRQTIY